MLKNIPLNCKEDEGVVKDKANSKGGFKQKEIDIIIIAKPSLGMAFHFNYFLRIVPDVISQPGRCRVIG